VNVKPLKGALVPTAVATKVVAAVTQVIENPPDV
jgi:hypothetical protein